MPSIHGGSRVALQQCIRAARAAHAQGSSEASVEKFDIRPEAVSSFGARHGDVVLGEQGQVATIIGSGYENGSACLWWHIEGGPDQGTAERHGARLEMLVGTVAGPERPGPDTRRPPFVAILVSP